jgi:tetratricopeptide (TPR) repeat protein
MSRFGNLELGDDSEDYSQSQPALTDEAQCLAEAQRAFEEGDFRAALRHYSRVLEFNPHSSAAWIGQVRMLIELDEVNEAKLWADKALESFPTEPELLAAKAVALARLDDLDAALAFSDSAIGETGSHLPYVWLARADVLLARRDKQADYCFEKALLLAPAEWLWHWLASRIRRFYRQFSLALKHAQEAVRLSATQSVVWLQLGLCQQALGLVEPARMSFEQARQLNPRCAAAATGLAELRHVKGWARFQSKLRGLFSS